jgi:uncharacterized protein
MKVRTALMLALCFAAMPAMAQSTSTAPPAKPVARTPPPSRLEPVVTPLPEKVDPAKDTAIRHLMELTQESKLGDNISGGLSMQVRNLMKPSLPDDRLQKFMVEFDQKFRDGMPSSKVIDAVVPIYAKNFSMEEIQGLIQFYESPLGKHVVETMGQVSRDSQETAVSMERDVAIKSLRTMTGDYPELVKMLPPENGAAPAVAPPAKPASTPAPGPAPAAPTLKPVTPQR